MDHFTDLWTIAARGGISLGIIAASSLLAIAVGVERVLALWGQAEAARRLSEAVLKCLYRGDVAEARAVCERSRSPFADILLAAFARHGKAPPATVSAAVERERIQVGLRLRSRLWILGTIGAVSPFIGLFGTVVGIMNAFRDLAAHPGGGFAVVAAGISEALVATAAGIGVAIEAVVLFNYFSARVAALSLTFKVNAEEVTELLSQGPRPEAADAAEASALPEAI